MRADVHGFPCIGLRLPEKAVHLKRTVNAGWIHAAHNVEVGIFGNLVHLSIFSTPHDPVGPQHRFKDGAQKGQPGTIGAVPEEQNDCLLMVEGQIAIGKRDRHPPVIRVLTAENLRQLYGGVRHLPRYRSAILQLRRFLCNISAMKVMTLCFLTFALLAQSSIPRGAKLFITPMDKNLDSFIVAEIDKQKLPVQVVLKQEEAQYVLTGFSQTTGSHWAEQVAASIFGGKDKYEASVKMVTADGKSLVWAGEAGDRSILFGEFRRGGQRKVAQRIVKQMKEALFK